jgi:hypothetical protein
MNDDKRIISDISDNANKRITKDLNVYITSLDNKRQFRACYERMKQSKKFKLDMTTAFRSKDFWRGLEDCGSWVEFRYYNRIDILKVQNANFCKRDKLCPACAIRRAYKQQLKFMEILESKNELIDLEWFYIVVPVRHSSNESYDLVFNRLENVRKKITMSMRNARRGSGNNFWSIFNGGMYSTETTKTANGWNIHLNLIINAPRGTKITLNKHNQALDLEEWLKVHADGSYVHNIQQIRERPHRESSRNDNEEKRDEATTERALVSDKRDLKLEEKKQALRDGIVEVLKYSLKFSSLSSFDLLEVYIRTYRKRLFGTFGNMRGVGLENVDLSGNLELDSEFIELIYRRIQDSGYVLHEKIYHQEKETKI